MLKAALNELQIEEFPDFLGSDIYHYLITKNGSLRERGFGTARSQEMALIKAYSEFCERSAMLSMSDADSSNGFAAHRTYEKAEIAAREELIERDLVLCSWLCRQPPVWLNTQIFSPLSESFLAAGMTLRVGVLGQIANTVVLCSILHPNDKHLFGCLFASAAAESLDVAIERIYLNQRRNLTYAMAFIKDGRNYIRSDQVTKPDDHRIYYMNPQNRIKWEWYLQQGRSFQSKSLEIKTTPVKINFPTPWSVFVCRATSEILQNYFIGRASQSNLNFNRLSEFCGHPIQEIEQSIHLLA